MGELIKIYEVALCLIRSSNQVPEKDIEVRITGLRKGEKMIEELYTKDEEGKLVRSKKRGSFYSIRNEEKPVEEIVPLLERLEDLVRKNGEKRVLYRILKGMFPSLKIT